MEEEWVVDRNKLREVWLEHPEWSKRKLADQGCEKDYRRRAPAIRLIYVGCPC
jgi:hypothetical protein